MTSRQGEWVPASSGRKCGEEVWWWRRDDDSIFLYCKNITTQISLLDGYRGGEMAIGRVGEGVVINKHK